MDERRQRIVDALHETGADWAVLTGQDTICYATGHPVSIEWGFSPFAGGASCAFVGRDGQAGLVLPNHEAGIVQPDVDVASYVGFSYDRPTDLVTNYVDALKALTGRMGVRGTIGVEVTTFTAQVSELLGADREVGIDRALRDRRAIKTPAEIVALTRSAEVAAAGQRVARTVSRPGVSELEAFAKIRCAMETAAGQRCPVTGDFVSGVERTAGGMGWPVDRTIEVGDPVISDLAPRVDGYWGDSCAGFILGQPAAEYERLFNRSKEALTAAETLMVPGKPIGKLDAELRSMVEVDGVVCHHHMGHGIGTSVHEWPRIIPNEDSVLREGMVLMVEPGGYRPGTGGVRLEYMMLVTSTGARPLAPFEHSVSVD